MEHDAKIISEVLASELENTEDLELIYNKGLDELVKCIISARLSFNYEYPKLEFYKDAYETVLTTQLIDFQKNLEKLGKKTHEKMFKLINRITILDRMDIDRIENIERIRKRVDPSQLPLIIQDNVSILKSILNEKVGDDIKMFREINKVIDAICNFYQKVADEGETMIGQKLEREKSKQRKLLSFAEQAFSMKNDNMLDEFKKLSLSTKPSKYELTQEGETLDEEPEYYKLVNKYAKNIGAKNIGGKKKKTRRKRKQRKYKTRK